MANLFDLIEPAMRAALRQANVPAPDTASQSSPASPDLAGEIASRAVEVLRDDPAFDHLANAEPWYRSRVSVGAILSALAPLFGLLGLEISPENRDVIVALIVALGGVAGPALTLYGRWAAKTPLGT